MTVFDDALLGEGLQDFFKNLGHKGFNVSTKLTKNVLIIPTRTLDITEKLATAAAGRNPKNVKSTLLELITFYITGESLYLETLVCICTI